MIYHGTSDDRRQEQREREIREDRREHERRCSDWPYNLLDHEAEQKNKNMKLHELRRIIEVSPPHARQAPVLIKNGQNDFFEVGKVTFDPVGPQESRLIIEIGAAVVISKPVQVPEGAQQEQASAPAADDYPPAPASNPVTEPTDPGAVPAPAPSTPPETTSDAAPTAAPADGAESVAPAPAVAAESAPAAAPAPVS